MCKFLQFRVTFSARADAGVVLAGGHWQCTAVVPHVKIRMDPDGISVRGRIGDKEASHGGHFSWIPSMGRYLEKFATSSNQIWTDIISPQTQTSIWGGLPADRSSKSHPFWWQRASFRHFSCDVDPMQWIFVFSDKSPRGDSLRQPVWTRHIWREK